MSESLVSRLLAHAAARPGDAAIVDERQTVTYEELARGVLGAAARLDALGVRAGDVVALSLGASRDNAADLAAVVYAVGYLGAALLPLYPDVPQGRKQELVAVFGARWSVAPQAEALGVAALPIADVCDKSHTAASAALRADAPERAFFLQFSSGTTANPKALSFTHRQLLLNTASNIASYRWGPGTRLVPAVQAPNKVGLRYLMRLLLAGGTLVNVPFPDSRRHLAEIAGALGANAAGGSPWQLRRLMQSPPAAGVRARPLEFLAAIGAMVGADEIRAMRRELTPNLHVAYGSTESGLIGTLQPHDDPQGGYAPLAGLDVEIVDASGARLPDGEQGLVRLRAPWMPQEYVGNPAETRRRFRDGWFYPGDAGMRDAGGRLFLRGREDEVINYGGIKVIPEDVEAQLLVHPGVAEAVVTSVPDAMAGEIPVAFVVLRPPATLEQLKAFCDERIDANSIPAAIFSVQSMPRTPDGKVQRARLKEHARSLSHRLHSARA